MKLTCQEYLQCQLQLANKNRFNQHNKNKAKLWIPK